MHTGHSAVKKFFALVLSALMLVSMVPMIATGAYAGEGDVAINGSNFPDDNFRAQVKAFDKNGDSVLSEAERNDVKEMDLIKKISPP